MDSLDQLKSIDPAKKTAYNSVFKAKDAEVHDEHKRGQGLFHSLLSLV